MRNTTHVASTLNGSLDSLAMAGLAYRSMALPLLASTRKVSGDIRYLHLWDFRRGRCAIVRI